MIGKADIPSSGRQIGGPVHLGHIGWAYRDDTDTVAADQRDANDVADLVNGKDYNLMVNNCLTKSIQIIKAYDESGGLNGLPDGHWTPPNLYYSATLDKAGWGKLTRLR